MNPLFAVLAVAVAGVGALYVKSNIDKAAEGTAVRQVARAAVTAELKRTLPTWQGTLSVREMSRQPNGRWLVHVDVATYAPDAPDNLIYTLSVEVDPATGAVTSVGA